MTQLKKIIENAAPKRLFNIFLTIWMVINFVQAIFTEITDDEAYYASLYGAQLAWGYFDHPPMVALITFLSDFFSFGNLSVRLFTIILQVCTIHFLWKLIDEHAPCVNKVVLFFTIAASMIMFTAYGFITAPDAPLLFFATLFLYGYRRFLKQESWTNTLLLAVSMTGMIYSKYHAFIIIGLVLLSNLKLLKSYRAWLAVVATAAMLVPHILWQTEMDFVTFKYHLIGRSFGFHWNEFLGHLPNQLVVFNPLAIGAVAYIVVKYRPRNLFERALYFQIIGFQIFFFLMTFKGYVQPHWTAPTTMAMIILLYRHSLTNEKILRFVKRWVAPTILLVLVARVLLVTELLPERVRFHGKERTNKAIEVAAGDLPVVFTGSFQRPSAYRYFTKNEGFVLSAVTSRITQFDIMQRELDYHGKSVFIRDDREGVARQYNINGVMFTGYITHNLQTVNRLQIDYELAVAGADSNDTLTVEIEITNPCAFDVDFNHPEFPVRVRAFYAIKRKTFFSECELNEPIAVLRSGETVKRRLQTTVPALEAGKYQFTLTLDNTICAAVNSFYSLIAINKNDR
ncbi:MAG: glycosyltransferase family 39 protein [Cytophagaceae bacterium]|jgi:hypothetical protein|nr:glycosyltransferase family 39 protein [Cytophagaceae bacterium]